MWSLACSNKMLWISEWFLTCFTIVDIKRLSQTNSHNSNTIIMAIYKFPRSIANYHKNVHEKNQGRTETNFLLVASNSWSMHRMKNNNTLFCAIFTWIFLACMTQSLSGITQICIKWVANVRTLRFRGKKVSFRKLRFNAFFVAM